MTPVFYFGQIFATCEECGNEEGFRAEKYLEFTDLDGNRGEYVTYIFCNECGHEIYDV